MLFIELIANRIISMEKSKQNNPESILKRWVKYFNEADLDELLDLYHSNSTVLPTFVPNALSTQEQIKEYLINCANRSAAVEIDNDTIVKQQLTENIYLLTGFYSFYFDNNRKREFKSRFTFLIDLSAEKPIQHHHSYQISESLFYDQM